MILAALAFADKLFDWMVNTHTSMVQQRGKGSEEQVWLLVTHVVREIGREFLKVRQGGARSGPVGISNWT